MLTILYCKSTESGREIWLCLYSRLIGIPTLVQPRHVIETVWRDQVSSACELVFCILEAKGVDLEQN